LVGRQVSSCGDCDVLHHSICITSPMRSSHASLARSFFTLRAQTAPESSAFIVVEHQPSNCNEFPVNPASQTKNHIAHSHRISDPCLPLAVLIVTIKVTNKVTTNHIEHSHRIRETSLLLAILIVAMLLQWRRTRTYTCELFSLSLCLSVSLCCG